MRHRKTDAHIATIRVSVLIDPMDHLTLLNASAAINGLAAHLPPGSAVEVLNSRFGRVDAPTVTPADLLAKIAPREMVQMVVSESAMSDIAQAVHDADHGGTPHDDDDLDQPESLRRVPRTA